MKTISGIIRLIHWHQRYWDLQAGDRTDCLIVCQNLAIGIYDPASGCLDAAFPFMKLPGLHRIIL